MKEWYLCQLAQSFPKLPKTYMPQNRTEKLAENNRKINRVITGDNSAQAKYHVSFTYN